MKIALLMISVFLSVPNALVLSKLIIRSYILNVSIEETDIYTKQK